MFATIIISFIAIFLAWLARFDKFKFGLELSFILLTIFMSIRYNFGNDYIVYLDLFNNTNLFADFKNAIHSNQFEIGWNILSFLFKPIGFFGMIIFLTIFEYFVIYKTIKRHVPQDWYWFAVFIFTFNIANMLVCASMMRQFLAVCIFLLSIDYIIQKKWIISILLVLLASSFHTSALILIPFCFIGFLDINLTTKKVVIWFSVYLLLYFFATFFLRDLFYKILSIEQFQRYQVYLGGEKERLGTGLGLIYSMIINLVLLLHQKYQSHEMKIIFILFFTSVFFYLFSEIAPIAGRLGYYFSILSIVCYPSMFHVIKNLILKYILLSGYIIVTLKTFIDFFDPSGIWYKSFNTYQTIFSVSNWM